MAASLPLHLRDPAWRGRLAWALAGAVILWPMLVMSEFRPWQLLDPASLRGSLQFLAGFFPPRLDAEFLALVARETWRTVAIATAGMTLGLVLGAPLALLAARALSVSALGGRMAWVPSLVRFVVRGVLIALRSIPS